MFFFTEGLIASEPGVAKLYAKGILLINHEYNVTPRLRLRPLSSLHPSIPGHDPWIFNSGRPSLQRWILGSFFFCKFWPAIGRLAHDFGMVLDAMFVALTLRWQSVWARTSAEAGKYVTDSFVPTITVIFQLWLFCLNEKTLSRFDWMSDFIEV